MQLEKNKIKYYNIQISHLLLTPWMDNTNQEIIFIIDKLGLTSSKRVVDIGCGNGRHSIELAKKGLHVTGIDISHDHICFAKKHSHGIIPRPEFINMDFLQSDLIEEFDAALNIGDGGIGYYQDDFVNELYISRIFSSLKKNGLSLISIHNLDFAIEKFPMKDWDIGNKSLSVCDYKIDPTSSRMEYSEYIIPNDSIYNRENFKPVLIASVRLYNLDQITKIICNSGGSVLAVYSNWEGAYFMNSNQSQFIIIISKKV